MPYIQSDTDINIIILASDEKCDTFSMCVDNVSTDKQEDHAFANEIDVVVVDHVLLGINPIGIGF